MSRPEVLSNRPALDQPFLAISSTHVENDRVESVAPRSTLTSRQGMTDRRLRPVQSRGLMEAICMFALFISYTRCFMRRRFSHRDLEL